jgi:hypothetical protein
MKIHKVLVILLFPLLMELMVSCCDCLETIFANYTHCDLTTYNIDNGGAKPRISQSNIINKKAFGIRLVINRNKNLCSLKAPNSSYFQSAHAFSCDCPSEFQQLPLDTITSLKILTINDFDDSHAESMDVSEYFYAFKNNRFSTIDKFIEFQETILLDPSPSPFELDLLLMTPPTIGTAHQFNVVIELSDGRVFNSRTGVITLN